MPASGSLFVSMEPGREVELVAAAKEGDRAAYLNLVRHYQCPVYRLAYAMTRQERAAANLAYGTFVRAWKEIRDFPEGRRFFPWLLRMARSIFAGTTSATQDASARERGSEGNPNDRGRELVAAFVQLRPFEQMALSLRVVERLSYEEIASLLETSMGVTVLRLSQARGLLLPHTLTICVEAK
jgi:RNA polymerase sigma-70 factor (ECF subfamily)